MIEYIINITFLMQIYQTVAQKVKICVVNFIEKTVY